MHFAMAGAGKDRLPRVLSEFFLPSAGQVTGKLKLRHFYTASVIPEQAKRYPLEVTLPEDLTI
jgi:hypothetical protein